MSRSNTESFPEFLQVLYEDNHLVAVNKRPGEIVQGDKTGDEPLSETMKKWLKEKYAKPGAVFLGVIHRIDRPVSGVVLFAKTSKCLERMNRMFRDKEVHKTYWAVVKNPPPDREAQMVRFLLKNERLNKSFAYTTPGENRLESILDYKLIASSSTYHLLEINPHTGRHHQIRVMLADMGCPIKGDLKYGFPRSNPDGSIHLHARAVRFIHPVSGEELTITSVPPDGDSLWTFFSNANQTQGQ